LDVNVVCETTQRTQSPLRRGRPCFELSLDAVTGQKGWALKMATRRDLDRTDPVVLFPSSLSSNAAKAISVPDVLRINAFRVLRIPATAALSEIYKAAESMKRKASLGPVAMEVFDIPTLGTVPRAEADIRAATGRLTNPVLRLRERLFWFHAVPGGGDVRQPSPQRLPSDPSERAARMHDEALASVCVAQSIPLSDEFAEIWVKALLAWCECVFDDDYWAVVLNLEEQGGFEPIALPSEVDALRKDAVRLAAEGLVMAGRDALVRCDTLMLRRVLGALGDLNETGPWAMAAREDIASPAVEQLQTFCKSIRDDFGSKIIQKDDAAGQNKSICDAALKQFKDEIKPLLHRILMILPSDHETVQRAREETAFCLSSIATDYTWADDFIVSEQLREEALEIAKDTVGVIRIEAGLEEIRRAARHQRVFGNLESISSAPSLTTWNTIGFKLYGHSDDDPETGSYVATHYFVALFLPLFPLARYRVIHTGGGYRFFGKLPLRKGDRWHLGISGALILAVILGIAFSGQNSGSPNTPNATSGYSSETSSTSSTVPTTAVPSEAATDETQSEQQTNDSDSREAQLSKLKARIDAGRSQISELEARLRPVDEEIKEINRQIDDLESELTSLKRQQQEGIQVDADEYNAKVRAHNNLVYKGKALWAANKSDLGLYHKLIKEDGSLVTRYNTLVRR
jgi:archaellum component FlaC